MELTPAMKQFMTVKEQYPDSVIFFRMGDFYEMFFDDAKTVSNALGITLTKRGKVPLAGIPYHALEPNLAKMVKAGHKVVICEQIEDPKQVRGRVVKRGVVQVITPGTVTLPSLLEGRKNNYLCAIRGGEDKWSLAFADVTTGEFFTYDVNKDQLDNELSRFEPAECIVQKDSGLSLQLYTTYVDAYTFSVSNAYNVLIRHFGTLSLEGFGIEKEDGMISVCGALLSYLRHTQKDSIGQITSLKRFTPHSHIILDSTTIRNLELFSNIRDQTKRGSLIEILDFTCTSMGGRMLRKWIQQPLKEIEQINERFDAVESFTNKTLVREEIRVLLQQCHDLQRLISRVVSKKASPKDLIAIKETLNVIPSIQKQLMSFTNSIAEQIIKLPVLTDLVLLIESAVKDEPATKVNEGNIIRKGYNEELDKLKEITSGGRKWIIELEEKEKEKTNIPTLKIGYNRVHGYYIEVTRKYSDVVPPTYIRRQTLANAERYITGELKQKEDLILGAEEKIHTLEYEIFTEVCEAAGREIVSLQNISIKLAVLDCVIGFSAAAVKYNYVRPDLTEKRILKIVSGRHPVIERLINEPFIPNDIDLDENLRMMIITGANMVGKSTVMRQTALIQLMAQIGCFVPAQKAELGVCDRIFTRVGAYDDLTMGQSTFMVEMTETSNILHNATEKSLIILDEIGRGTSTFDGIALAWSIAEYIYKNIKAKTMFATHYHQLNLLGRKFSGIMNYNVMVKEAGDEIVFLRKLVQGGTDRSYGIHVASLAGLPSDVISRSREIMNKLEQGDRIGERMHNKQQDNMDLGSFLR